MGKRITGSALLLVALFMLAGFLKAEPAAGAAAIAVTLMIAVAAPAAAGAYLWWSSFAEDRALAGRRESLRRQTLEAELLKLAGRHGGKLTVVEAVAELAFDAATVEQALGAMAADGLAELEVSDAGVLVYAFYDLQHLDGKADARGVLDA